MLGRLVIDSVRPRTLTGDYPAKAVVGEVVRASADIFRDGHVILAARLRWRPAGARSWHDAPMRHLGNDAWEGTFEPTTQGMHEFVVEAWTDHFATWRHDVRIKLDAGQDVDVELEEGAILLRRRSADVGERGAQRLEAVAAVLGDESRAVFDRLSPALDPSLAEELAGVPDPDDVTRSSPHRLWVDRQRALVGAWYEFFPRSEGGFQDAAKRLPAIAEMGFDVVYLPPIHPIGRTARKGRNNEVVGEPDDPGSPWAIGAEEGGHTAVDPMLGTLDDFDDFLGEARNLGLEVALDYALQCSPDHPWVKAHPEWFHHRPDGTVKYAENPPKKYQDIYPINFWPEHDADRRALWEECRRVLEFWIDHGVRIFRVDNPHTKPMAFWEWLLPQVRGEQPDLVFLSEAFTRPKVMAKLAEVGFSQSYTYFTWRTTKPELVEYLTEICHGPVADYMRPNFWPNTPDILSGPLRNGPPSAFKLRLALAATMVPSYGIYSGYELYENLPAAETNEEYLNSEKYELKQREWSRADSLAPFVTRLNDIRRRHPAFHELHNIEFHHSNNGNILAYSKVSSDKTDVVLMVVNLDPFAVHDDTLWLDLDVLGLPADRSFEAHDEITGATYTWYGPSPYVRLDPAVEPAHVLHLRAAP